MRKVNVSFQISYALISISIFLLGMNYLLLQTLPFYSLRNSTRILALMIAIASVFFYPNPIAFSTSDILLVLFSIPGCVVSHFESNHLLFLSLFLICLKPYSVQELIKMCKNVSVLMLLAYIALYKMKYINWIIYGLRRRNTLGFAHVNAAMLLCFSFAVIWILDSPTVKRTIIGLAFIQWVFLETNSRTSYVAFLVFCSFIFFDQVNLAFEQRRTRLSILPKETGVCKRSAMASHFETECAKPAERVQKNRNFFALLIQISALSLIFWPFFSHYLNRLFPFLDSLLSFRVKIAMFVVSHLSLKQLVFGGTGGMDHVGLCLLAEYGVFMFLFFTYRILYSLKNAIRYSDTNRLALVLSVVTLASAESFLIRPEILISIVFWKSILYDYRDEYGKGGFHEDSLYNK